MCPNISGKKENERTKKKYETKYTWILGVQLSAAES